MNIIRTARPLLVLCALVVAVSLGSGCKSAGEKKYDEAKALQKRGMNEQAIAAFEDAAELLEAEDNEPGKAWEKLSSIHKGSQNFVESEKYIRMAIKDDPEDFERYARLMSVLRQTNRFDEAYAIFDDIIEHPNLRFELDDKKRLEDERAAVEAAEGQYERDMAEAAAKAAAGEDDDAADGESGDSAESDDAPAADETAAAETGADDAAAGEATE